MLSMARLPRKGANSQRQARHTISRRQRIALTEPGSDTPSSLKPLLAHLPAHTDDESPIVLEIAVGCPDEPAFGALLIGDLRQELGFGVEQIAPLQAQLDPLVDPEADRPVEEAGRLLPDRKIDAAVDGGDEIFGPPIVREAGRYRTLLVHSDQVEGMLRHALQHTRV